MTQSPYELLVRFASDGSVGGVSVRYLLTVGNKTIEGDPEPLSGVSDPFFQAFANQFSAAAVSERDALQSQVSILTGERDVALAQVAALTQEKETLTETSTQLSAQIAELNARVATLVEQVQFDPRIIEANAFIARISSDETIRLFASTDPNVQAIAKMLLDYKANDWRIELDSAAVQQAVGYLQLVGMITEERALSLLRDGTRAEAYINDGSV